MHPSVPALLCPGTAGYGQAVSPGRPTLRRDLLHEPRWQLATAVSAVLAAVVVAWVTLAADFLAHPEWLALQKADFILGPVFIGLYWLRRRPHSRFGPLLIAFGFVGVLYGLQSASEPWLFSAGLVWENVVGLAAYVLILTFPTGRLDGLAPKLILLVATFGAVLPAIVILLLLPQVGAGGSISGCRELCPENVLAIASDPALALDLWEIFRYVVIGVALATAALLIWRLVTGTAPQRRALAIGASVALVFLLLQVAFHLIALLAPDATELQRVVAWAFAIARAAMWYGFLAALIAAQLFAARTLHRLVRESLQRPSLPELEAMLRKPLGDPGLRLAFLDTRSGSWIGEQPRPQPEAGQSMTMVEHEGAPTVAIVHDAQLDDDPELLQTAGGVALLAADNAALETAWNDALRELRASRARIVRAGDTERRKLERDLHDGVQQRLVAIGIDMELTGELSGPASDVRRRLDGIVHNLDEALEELREIARGLYPPVLSDLGLVAALDRVQLRVGVPVEVHTTGVGRHPPEAESAVYYCCLEAIQNATKHGGAGTRVEVALVQGPSELTFRVTDDGVGFDASTVHAGAGLQNMRDRLGALDGRLSIVTAPGQGTRVVGSLPLPDGQSTTLSAPPYVARP